MAKGVYTRTEEHKKIVAENGRKLSIILRAGQRFERLVTLERTSNRSGHIVWKCKCDCGNIVEVIASDLKRGTTRSCGCLVKDLAHTVSDSTYKVLYRQYKRNARIRNLKFELDLIDFIELLSDNCFYCGSAPSNIMDRYLSHYNKVIYNGIDRVDNNEGYTVENVVTCCEQCNKAKRDLTLKQFINWINRVYKRTIL